MALFRLLIFHSFDQDANQWTLGVRNAHATTPYGILIKYAAASPNNTGSNFIFCEDAGATTRMDVRSNGGIANFSSNNVNLCDEREKKNIVDLDSTWDCLKIGILKSSITTKTLIPTTSVTALSLSKLLRIALK
jgi:hypothetical protein